MGMEMECEMCLEDVNVQETEACACGHRFCRGCWDGYLDEAAKNRHNCLRCPHAGCTFSLTNNRIMGFEIKPRTLSRLNQRTQKFQLESFVEHTRDLVGCIAPGCEHVVQVFDFSCKQVFCQCGYDFCPSCKDETHRPCPCAVAQKWIAKNSSESENLQWIIAKTKRCPKCRSPIEKTQGCNHMTCRNPACTYEFCWLCLGPWSEHGSSTGGFYKCNIYEAKKNSGDIEEAEQARDDAQNELERYTFYFERYQNHKNAIQALKDSMENTEIRMGELMSEYQWTPDQTNFLREAMNAVLEARKLLTWSYPVGYYMEENFPLRNLFHQSQKDLEMYTEHLHELTDQPLQVYLDAEKKEEVINHQRMVKKYVKNLLIGIETEINPLAFEEF